MGDEFLLRATGFVEADTGMHALTGTFGEIIVGELFDRVSRWRCRARHGAGSEQCEQGRDCRAASGRVNDQMRAVGKKTSSRSLAQRYTEMGSLREGFTLCNQGHSKLL